MFRPVDLPDSITGHLYLSSMLGRYEPLETDINDIGRLDIKHVVRLADIKEIEKKSPQYAKLLNDNKYSWIDEPFPMPDFGVPPKESWDELITLSKNIVGFLKKGENVLIHCAGGHGRTGTFSTIVLMSLGLSKYASLEAVDNANAAPEVKAQNELIDWASDKLAN